MDAGEEDSVGYGTETGNERRTMEITKKLGAILAVLALSSALAGCSDGAGLDDEGRFGDRGEGSREGRFEEGGGSRGSGETEIRGFSVEGPGGEEISIPEGEPDPGEAAAYTESVRSILDDDPRDLSSLVDPEAGLEGETVNLGLSAESVQDALDANQEAYEDLQELETPGGLGDVQDALLDSRETAISAYDNINQAFINDASADEIADAVEESLPEIEYSNAETSAILQELERASSVR